MSGNFTEVDRLDRAILWILHRDKRQKLPERDAAWRGGQAPNGATRSSPKGVEAGGQRGMLLTADIATRSGPSSGATFRPGELTKELAQEGAAHLQR